MQHLDLIVATAAAVAAGIVSTVVLLRRGRAREGMFGAVLTAVLIVAVAVGAPARLGSPTPTASAASSPPVTATDAAPTAIWTPKQIHTGRGYARIDRLQVPVFPRALRVSPLRSRTEMPSHGSIGSVVIPATASRFVARPTIVYLPPAARVAQPRLLPVIIAFSGQSKGAGPADLVWGGHLEQMMDAIAARRHGVAPIVVVPDQLGPATGNPMCVDSKHFGRVGTYVMHDVRDWVLRHLPVAPQRQQWTIAGFSEGGTCAIQFAAAHPEVFGSVVDVSGELAPTNGSTAHTIAVGFGGSRIAYQHATPAWILSHHHYRNERAYFAVGALDRVYGPVAPRMEQWSRRAGMTTELLRVPHLAHNWNTAAAGFDWSFTRLAGWWGI